MPDIRKISISIPTWNRYEMTIECFAQILHDERVEEVVISDDASTDGSYEKLCEYFKDEPKVKIFQNETNQDCYRNKKTAIELSTNDWCILADSDNIFGVDYLDKIFEYEWNEDIIFTPDFAMPHFDFRNYSNVLLTKENISQYIDLPMVETCLNANNFFINKKSYLQIWDGSINPMTSDSIYFCYNWLKSGRGILITQNMQYQHRVHPQSHYQTKNYLTEAGLHENILQQLRNLK